MDGMYYESTTKYKTVPSPNWRYVQCQITGKAFPLGTIPGSSVTGQDAHVCALLTHLGTDHALQLLAEWSVHHVGFMQTKAMSIVLTVEYLVPGPHRCSVSTS